MRKGTRDRSCFQGIFQAFRQWTNQGSRDCQGQVLFKIGRTQD